jgi:NADPH:quinone reductase-like Zn-dependent oxidoreductase
MKAVSYRSYGGPEVLEVGELPDPKLGPDSVLIRVKAASVNPVDWKIQHGYLDAALDVVFPVVPGWDVAGVVERTGAGVTEFSVGDEVYGYVRKDSVQGGTFAELVAAPVRTVARKPANLSWAEAAAVPLAGLTALQSLDALAVRAGDTVLVHAAAGGVGMFAVQIAVARGARVIGTASTRNHDFLRGLGAEPVAYGEGLADAVRALAPEGVDAALDLVGGEAVPVSRELLTTRSRIASIIDASVTGDGGRYVFVRPDSGDLDTLRGLAETGKLKVEIAHTFPLEEAAKAQELSATGHTRGKIALVL